MEEWVILLSHCVMCNHSFNVEIDSLFDKFFFNYHYFETTFINTLMHSFILLTLDTDFHSGGIKLEEFKI